MKIGIDVSPVLYGTGVSTYTKNLVKNLLFLDKENEYLLFGGSLRRKKELSDFAKSLKAQVDSKFLPLPPTLADILWNRLHIIKIERLIGKVDIFHSSDWTQPPSKAHKVTTVHDLSPLRFPKLTDPKIVSVHKARLKWIVKEVDRVIVPSRATKEDLVLMKVKRNNIRIISEAADTFFKPSGRIEIDRVKNKFKLGSRYLISVGVGERKNTKRVMDAYRMIKHGGLELVIIGEDQTGLKEETGIKLLGYVGMKDLRALYSGAEALVYPSIYEGFGIPILEAFACNCPVVTSDVSSLPEVADNSAVLVDPFSINSIAEGIEKVIKNRDIFVKRGKLRLSIFSWRKTAEMTLGVYNELLG